MNVLNAMKKIALFSLVLGGTVACQSDYKTPKINDDLDQGEKVIEKKELDMEKPNPSCPKPCCEDSCSPCEDPCDPCECSAVEPEVEAETSDVEVSAETAEVETTIEPEDNVDEQVAAVEIEPIEKEYISNGEKIVTEVEDNEETTTSESVL